MSKAAYTINLAGFDSLVYEKIRYPAGEVQVRIRGSEVQAVSSAEEIRVMARIRGAEDVMELAMLADAIMGIKSGVSNLELVLPYMPYARADRRFVEGDCFGARAFRDLVHDMGFEKVRTFDIHSDPGLWYLKNVGAERVISKVVRLFAGRNTTFAKKVVVLFPDQGAADRYALADHAGDSFRGWVDIEKLYCTKERDPLTGKLSGFKVPGFEEFRGIRDVLIVDDICDGGGTFLGIAAGLKAYDLDLGLYVSHGIFSKGIGILKNSFDRIYTTNSFYDGRFGYDVKVLDCYGELLK